ncbi:MAG: hypothetical protein WAO71_08440 [Gallionella sp.]
MKGKYVAILLISLFFSYLLIQVALTHNFLVKTLRWRYVVYELVYLIVTFGGFWTVRIWDVHFVKSMLIGVSIGYIASLIGFFCSVVFFPPTLVNWVLVDPLHRVVQLFFWPYLLFGIIETLLTVLLIFGINRIKRGQPA